jgi:hypothetical protein
MFASKLRIICAAVFVIVCVMLLVAQWNISTSVSPNVSDATSAEISASGAEDAAQVPEGVEQDGTDSEPVSAPIPAELGPVLSEDANALEKVKFFFAWIWHRMFGPKEPKPESDAYDMNCTTKKGGGKVCNIIRD